MSWKPQSVRTERIQSKRDRDYLAREKRIEVETADESIPPATSTEPCPRCQIPGFRGCKHQRPYDHNPPQPAPPRGGRRSAHHRKH